MSQTEALYEIQRIDNEIREKKQRLGEVLRAQKETAEIIAARQTVADLEQQLHASRGRHKDLSLEMGSVADKAQNSETRLYSGKVSNPKELADLQHEIEALTRRRSNLENDVLEAQMTVENEEASLREAQANLEALTTQWAASVVTLKEEQQTLAIRLVNLGPIREKRVARIAPALMKTYDRLAAQKGGVAVARLKGNQCLSCRVTVPADRIRAAEQEALVYCDSCGRILCPR